MSENNNNCISGFYSDICDRGNRRLCAGNNSGKRNYEIILGMKGRAQA